MIKLVNNTVLNTSRYKIPFFMFIAAIALVIWLVLRLVLWVDVGISQLSLAQAIKAAGVGLRFDVSALCFLLVPFLLLSILIPNSWRGKSWANACYWRQSSKY